MSEALSWRHLRKGEEANAEEVAMDEFVNEKHPTLAANKSVENIGEMVSIVEEQPGLSLNNGENIPQFFNQDEDQAHISNHFLGSDCVIEISDEDNSDSCTNEVETDQHIVDCVYCCIQWTNACLII